MEISILANLFLYRTIKKMQKKSITHKTREWRDYHRISFVLFKVENYIFNSTIFNMIIAAHIAFKYYNNIFAHRVSEIENIVNTNTWFGLQMIPWMTWICAKVYYMYPYIEGNL